MSTDLKISYAPPSGKPLGTTNWFRFGAGLIKPLLNLIAKRDWRGVENLPKSGAAIAVCNHISYVDPLLFTHFLYDNGRAVRYLGKASLFKMPIIGRVLLGAGQIPVERESSVASHSLQHAIAFLKSGHLLGVYPEGTLTRDENYWPMRGKTGIARLAILTQVPVIPCAQWGAQEILPAYSKKLKLFPRTKVVVVAGKPLDFSKWYGRAEDPVALEEATAYVMSAITRLLEQLRGEKAPAE
ncbi:MAG: lysophospholipid acyltransferase family protein, partial [Actinobacteria bacterium]|nr:lysophospholipid acyltransferase family protein [Actinomycetota bacterium]